jgi:hypothetical protein
LVSSDDGATWTSPGDGPVTGEGVMEARQVVAATGAFWIATHESYDGMLTPDTCYRDLRLCRLGSRPVLLRSTDGMAWVEVDLETTSLSWIERVVDVGDGLMVVGRALGTSRLETWTWPSDGEPPRRPPSERRSADELPLVGHGAELEVGATYRFPLHFHCGIGYLGNFNGVSWFLDAGSTEWDPAVDPFAAAPAHWPIAQEFVFGTVALVDADTIEYTIPSGEVIAVYEASAMEPPGCA